MSEFRRFVIGLVNLLLLLAIVLATIGGAISGGAVLPNLNIGALRPLSGSEPIVGAIGGAIFGFLVSAIPAVFLFLLTEIADNTRQTLLELRRTSSAVRQ
jgi:hypothetical protein